MSDQAIWLGGLNLFASESLLKCSRLLILVLCLSARKLTRKSSRKEVIQPHLPIRLPCYDFVPIIGPTFGACFLAVSPATSGKTNFRGVTGGVCKARERIHRSIADLRLLAIPTSWSRVADSNPN
jgi:hypothetical protein